MGLLKATAVWEQINYNCSLETPIYLIWLLTVIICHQNDRLSRGHLTSKMRSYYQQHRLQGLVLTCKWRWIRTSVISVVLHDNFQPGSCYSCSGTEDLNDNSGKGANLIIRMLPSPWINYEVKKRYYSITAYSCYPTMFQYKHEECELSSGEN